MRKHTADETMNCLACCLAGLFDRDLASIPTVHKWSKDDSQGYWFNEFYKWSRDILGYTPVSIVDDTMDDLFHIAVIKESTTGSHAVIARGVEVLWDPNPKGKIVTNLLDVAEWEYSLIFIKSKGKCVQARLEKEYQDEQGIMG